MKTNMKLKSSLWALAFAVAAVSCSDDLEENGGGTGITAEDGEGVYVTVNVGMASGPTTKTGELGNGDLEDSEMESAVNDINIYLIPNASQTAKITTNDLSIVNANGETAIFCGYSTDLEPATGTIEHHDAKATVEISVPDLDKWYHVVAVVNAGDELKFTKLAELRDYLQIKLWEGDNNKYGVANDFVMSTHQMYQDDDAGGSDLFVSQANSDPGNPAETTVYVERLAARIDLQVADVLVSENGTTLNGNSDQTSKVKLTGYQVVNQLIGGTYMLKRVSGNVTTVTGALADAQYPDPFYSYLSNEEYGNSKYNYVLDPWTANKTYTAGENTTFPPSIKNATAYYSGKDAFTQTAANGADIYLKDGLYKNHFDADLNDQTGFMTFNGLTDIDKTTEDGTYTPLLYTGENTTDVEQQKNGFSTGVIFESEFKPEHVSLYEEATATVTDEHDYTAGEAFFVANYKHSGTSSTTGGGTTTITTSRTLSNDLRTIAALGLKEGSNVDIVKYMFNEGAQTWPSGKTQIDMQAIVDGMSGGKLVVAFKDYLQAELDKVTGTTTFESIQGNLTWAKFVDAKGLPTEQELETSIADREQLMETYSVAYYAKGIFGAKNYLKYWIKHEPRDENEDMGVMEYAIVRNNVYQLQVSGIKNLGDPLPFTPGVDDPDNPNKETDIFILVNLYVRNWVKRSNTGIIL